MSAHTDSLLKVSDAAEKLNVSHATVRRLAARGSLRPVRLSARLLRFTPQEVERLVNAPKGE
jgi:excisionase family DNA binding protein